MIEAHWLFGLPADKDRCRGAQAKRDSLHVSGFATAPLWLSSAARSMRLPIAYALSYRTAQSADRDIGTFGPAFGMTFEPPDKKRFPLELAYEALRRGGAMPAVLNAANEEAVKAFLSKKDPVLTI